MPDLDIVGSVELHDDDGNPEGVSLGPGFARTGRYPARSLRGNRGAASDQSRAASSAAPAMCVVVMGFPLKDR